MTFPSPSSDIERWRGETDARLRDAERRLEALNGNIARGADALQALTLSMTEFKSELKGSVKAWGIVLSILGSTACAILVGCVVYFITH